MSWTLGDFIEPVMLLGCSRCANQDEFYESLDATEAQREFVRRGWSYEQGRVFCPSCNRETK